MIRTAYVVRHLQFEDLGTFAAVLEERGYRIHYLEAGLDNLAPAAHAELLIILGGPIGAYEEERYPFLHDELALLRTRLAEERPTLGICLGAQLMARALGAAVYPGPGKEIGWFPLNLTPQGADSPLAPLAGELTNMLHWHGDTFDLPEGAQLLASTPLCRHQAFSLGKHALAFQCHPEADASRIEQWLIGHAGELNAMGIDPVQLRRESQHHAARLRQQGRECLRRWLGQLA